MMRNILPLLSLFFLPFMAMAADKPAQMADTTIDAAVKRFGPSFCNKTMRGMQVTAEKIYACYQNTSKDSADYEQCILGDEVISSLVQPMRAISKSTGMPEPLKDMPFFSNASIVERTLEINQYPKYKNYTDQEKKAYHDQSVDAFFKQADFYCKLK